MIETVFSPPWIDPADYVDFLNRGFSRRGSDGRWNRVSFDWYLRREFNGQAADIVVRCERGRLLSGASLCHRQLTDRNGRPVDVGIMGTATTIAAERGRGHYAALLNAVVERCRERGQRILLGFATRDNSSVRGFTRLGARLLPSYYLVAGGDGRAPNTGCGLPAGRELRAGREGEDIVLTDAEASGARRREHRDGVVSFHYERPEDWRRQFLLRPGRVRIVRPAHDCLALIETVGCTDRLQWLSAPAAKVHAVVAMLSKSARSSGRTFFMYTMDALLAAAARRLGFRVKHGLLLFLPIDAGDGDIARLAAASWHVTSGDRM